MASGTSRNILQQIRAAGAERTVTSWYVALSMAVTLIGIAGGSGSGKTRLASELRDSIGPDRVTLVPFDAYYKDLRHLDPADRHGVNFDHPDSLDDDLLGFQLDGLAEGLDVAIPVYDFAQHRREDDLRILPANEIVIVEGILLLAFPELVERFDYTVFRQCNEETRLARRVERDVNERGRTEESVRAQFAQTVGPMHDQFVEPSAQIADRVVTQDEDLTTVVAELREAILSLTV